jgi:hypothetical protein
LAALVNGRLSGKKLAEDKHSSLSFPQASVTKKNKFNDIDTA